MLEFVKSLLSGAAGAGIVAGIFMLLGKHTDYAHEDKKQKMTEKHDIQKELKTLSDKVEQTASRIDRMEHNDRALMKAVSALLLHNMTGNATGKMQKAHEELTTYIIEHGGTNNDY